MLDSVILSKNIRHAALAVLAFAGLIVFVQITLGFSKIAADFAQDYAAARAYLNNESIYSSNLERYLEEFGLIDAQGITNNHPPLATLLALPFTAMPYSSAFVVWNLIFAGLLIFFVLPRACALASIRFNLLFAPLIFLWFPVIGELANGQFAIILTAFYLLFLQALLQKKDWLAGLALSVCVLIKVFPVLLLLGLIALRRTSALIWTIAFGVLELVILCVLFGCETLVKFAEVSQLNALKYAGAAVNQSILGVSQFFSSLDLYQPWKTSTTLALLLALIFIGLRPRRQPLSQLDEQRAFDLFLLAGILLSPVSWNHYYILLIPCLIREFSLIRNSAPLDRTVLIIAVLLFALPDVYIARWIFNMQLTPALPWFVFPLVKAGFLGCCCLLFALRRSLQIVFFELFASSLPNKSQKQF